MTARPHRLRVEHLAADHPQRLLGIGTPTPRLSWWAPGDSGSAVIEAEIDGAAHTHAHVGPGTLVAWPFAPLRSRAEVRWRVRTADSEWSEAAEFTVGLLAASDWSATWIEPVVRAGDPDRVRPAEYLRHTFTARGVRRAILHATARGIYEPYVNGVRVGDELMPGFTSYTRRLAVQSFDVTALLREGDNAIGAVLTDGWYRGQLGAQREVDQFGERTGLLMQLELTDADGVVTTIGTGVDWASGRGSIEAADLIAGQRQDLRVDPIAWSLPGFDASDWPRAAVVPGDPVSGGVRLTGLESPPVGRVQRMPMRELASPRSGVRIFDAGQNIAGWARIDRLGPRGTRTVLEHGETLDAAGDLTTVHIEGLDFATGEVQAAGQVDEVVAAGIADEHFEPRHTTHGFRYVRVTGGDPELSADHVTAVVVHTRLEQTGSFACSDDRLNRLHEIAQWSFRGNAIDIPTDCPTRERAGWTGDWQLYLPTAAFLFDVAGFSTKWLRDLSLEQDAEGRIYNFAPSQEAVPGNSPAMGIPPGSAGWGDAIALVPWQLYRWYGDEQILRDAWPHIERWLGFVDRTAQTGRHPSRIARSAEPLPHERYLWDSGFHWGEWLLPGDEIDMAGGHEDFFAEFAAADKADVATAYFAHTAGVAAQIAAVLGEADAAERYRDLEAHVRAAWRAEFIVDGAVTPRTQHNLVRALDFDLVPEELRAATATALAEVVRASGHHVGTGFLATPALLRTLADNGHADAAARVLWQDTWPSWMTMLDRGATTVWEQWRGVDEHGVAHGSLNHYSKGAVISFLHSHIGGLRLLEPGFRRFSVAPRALGGVTWARVHHDSPFGRIEAGWRVDADRLTVDLTVPPGTTAEVDLGDGAPLTRGPGTWTLTTAQEGRS